MTLRDVFAKRAPFLRFLEEYFFFIFSSETLLPPRGSPQGNQELGRLGPKPTGLVLTPKVKMKRFFFLVSDDDCCPLHPWGRSLKHLLKLVSRLVPRLFLSPHCGAFCDTLTSFSLSVSLPLEFWLSLATFLFFRYPHFLGICLRWHDKWNGPIVVRRFFRQSASGHSGTPCANPNIR